MAFGGSHASRLQGLKALLRARQLYCRLACISQINFIISVPEKWKDVSPVSLGPFAKLRKGAIGFFMALYVSVRMEKLAPTGFS